MLICTGKNYSGLDGDLGLLRDVLVARYDFRDRYFPVVRIAGVFKPREEQGDVVLRCEVLLEDTVQHAIPCVAVNLLVNDRARVRAKACKDTGG